MLYLKPASAGLFFGEFMLGCIFGDIVGSVYEFNPVQEKEWPILRKLNSFTDDTILICACMEWLQTNPHINDPTPIIKAWGAGYSLPMGGYGARFVDWLSNENAPNNSWGNGAVMRIAPIAWLDSSARDAQTLTKRFTQTSHNHPRSIRSAGLYVAILRMLIKGASKSQVLEFWKTQRPGWKPVTIEQYVEEEVIRWKSSADETLDQAVLAWYQGDDLISTIRNSVDLQGDADTIACIAGGLAEAQWGTPDAWIIEAVFERLPSEIREYIISFYRMLGVDLRMYKDIPCIHDIPRSEQAQLRWQKYSG